MRFFVRRTSMWSDNKPCEEAIEGTYVPQDRRTVNDPRKITVFKNNPEKAMKMWYGEGTNHRVEHGQIVRDMEEQKAWFLEIETLEQLMSLNKKYGDLVVGSQIFTYQPEIEIYDTYRE